MTMVTWIQCNYDDAFIDPVKPGAKHGTQPVAWAILFSPHHNPTEQIFLSPHFDKQGPRDLEKTRNFAQGQ